jgi:hypothetical protein
MPKHDAFIAEFEKLLGKIPEHYSLEQWQYAYRNVVYSMGLKILERFPEAIVGPDPATNAVKPPQPPQMRVLSAGGPPPALPAGAGGSTGGHRPNVVCKLVCAVLDIT